MSYSLRNKVADYGGLTMTERYVLETLATYANDDGTSCRPAIDRVAHDIGSDRKTPDRAIQALKKLGVLVVVKATPRRPVEYRINLSALPRREAYVPKARPSARDKRPPTGGATGPVGDVGDSTTGGATGPVHSATPTPPLAPRRPPLAPLGKSTGPVVGHNPVSNPVSNPVKGAAAPLGKNCEGYVRAVVAEWRAARNKPGLGRFTDDGAIKNLKTAAERAWTQGCTLDDAARAIAVHASDPNANPWYVDEWAREARAEREEVEDVARKAQERRELDAVSDRERGLRPLGAFLEDARRRAAGT